jgi:hypothetical protein
MIVLGEKMQRLPLNSYSSVPTYSTATSSLICCSIKTCCMEMPLCQFAGCFLLSGCCFAQYPSSTSTVFRFSLRMCKYLRHGTSYLSFMLGWTRKINKRGCSPGFGVPNVKQYTHVPLLCSRVYNFVWLILCVVALFVLQRICTNSNS